MAFCRLLPELGNHSEPCWLHEAFWLTFKQGGLESTSSANGRRNQTTMTPSHTSLTERNSHTKVSSGSSVQYDSSSALKETQQFSSSIRRARAPLRAFTYSPMCDGIPVSPQALCCSSGPLVSCCPLSIRRSWP